MEIKLGSDVFNVEPLPAFATFILQPKIAPAVGEVLEELPRILGIAGALGIDADAQGADALRTLAPALAPLIGRLSSRLPPAELEHITRTLLAGATVRVAGSDKAAILLEGDGRGGVFDLVMRGRTIDTWKLLWHAIQVNYPDFFTALRGSAPKSPAGNSSATSTT